MRRIAVLILLLLATLWQSVDPLRGSGSPDRVADLRHALLHWQDEGHHHHDDGGWHLDDSGEALGHVMADNATTPVLPAERSPNLPDVDAESLRPGEARAGPPPYLDGLIRPPRPTA